MTYIGIDLGGSHAACGLVSGSTLLAKQNIPISDNASLAALLPRLEDSICGLLAHASNKHCEGIAFSFCGIVDGVAGRIIQTNG